MRPAPVRTVLTGVAAVLVSLVMAGTSAPAGAAARVVGSANAAEDAASTGPTCMFNGSSLALLTGITPGEKIAIACTGLPVLHPYLILETSLLLGIDPKAAPLLSGDIVSLAGLQAALAALPEINPAALALTVTGLTGDLDYTYVVPSSQASDPNATCPPSTLQFDSGLIGCGLAMIDLTSFKPVGAGSAVLQYRGEPELPPGPTLSLSATTATDGQSVSVGDVPGATTYWWLSTLYALEGLLGGGTPAPPSVTVTLSNAKTSVTASNTVTVSPATYTEPTFTPPRLSGGFTVPAKLRGKYTVTVGYHADLLSFPLSISATAPLKIKK